MTVRRIKVEGLRAPEPREHGRVPEIAWLGLHQLVVDEDYQRPLTEGGRRIVERIAARFDWAAFGPLVVADRGDGTYAILDGQHRAHAAALAGVASVPCAVHRLAPRDEARAFAGINGEAQPMSPALIYRAALAAGEDWAVRARDAVQAAGAELMTSVVPTADRRPGQVMSHALVREAILLKRDEALTAALSAIARDPQARAWYPWWASVHLGPWVRAVVGLFAVDGVGPRAAQSVADLHANTDWRDVLGGVRRLIADDPRYRGRSETGVLGDTMRAMLVLALKAGA